MRLLCSFLLALSAAGGVAAPLDSGWVSYYNGADGWFAFQGPQRAMKLNPADFGLECPLEVESLKTWWYWGMGSRDDTVYTFRIYGNDGSTVLFQSESLVAPVTNWTYYGLSTPVRIDSGSFYIATTHRLSSPYAHPYVNVDTGPTNHSYYGSPGAWTLDNVGEFCFFAFVRELPTGVGDGRWVGLNPKPAMAILVHGCLRLPGSAGAALLDATGRRVMDLKPGANDVHLLSPGVYLVRPEPGGTATKVVVH
jgi:hypothetical protein